ncbi:MAG: hypothetical protein R3A80_02865 [Bdellovibrionota bacterium]
MKKVKVKREGFVILSVLALGAFLFASSISIFMYKRVLDQDTLLMTSRHSMEIAVDTLKTSIQLNMADKSSLAAIKTDIQSLSNFNLPVPGTSCNGVECKIKVKVDPTAIRFEERPIGSGDEYALIDLVYEGNMGDSKNKVKIPDTTIEVLLPKQTVLTTTVVQDLSVERQCLALNNPWLNSNCAKYLKNYYCLENPTDTKCTSLNPLICPHTQPIFLGTRVDENGIERAVCKGIVSQSNIKTTSSSTEITSCNVSQGKWLYSIEEDFSLNCPTFPEGFQDRKDIVLCSDPKQVARSYELDAGLNVIHVNCVDPGGPYDFVSQTRTWN